MGVKWGWLRDRRARDPSSREDAWGQTMREFGPDLNLQTPLMFPWALILETCPHRQMKCPYQLTVPVFPILQGYA